MLSASQKLTFFSFFVYGVCLGHLESKNVHSFKEGSTILNVGEIWTNSIKPEKILQEIFQATGGTDEECARAIEAVLSVTNAHWTRPGWTIQMLDATGKPGGSGLLTGNVHALGSFDQCMSIQVKDSPPLSSGHQVPDMQGRYVLAMLEAQLLNQVPNTKTSEPLMMNVFDSYSQREAVSKQISLKTTEPEETTSDPTAGLIALLMLQPLMGVCVPSVCSPMQVEESLNSLLNATLNNLISKPNGTIMFNYRVSPEYTYVNESEIVWSGGDIAAIFVLTLVIFLAVAGTVVDVVVNNRSGLLVRIMLCFSLHSNGKKLFSTKKNPNNIDCLNGIRFLSMCWVVLGHATLVSLFNIFNPLFNVAMPVSNPNAVNDALNNVGMMTIISGTLAVDTFFFLSGLLMAFLFLKQLHKVDKIINPFPIILHRYIRLTPTYAMIMLVLSTLLIHVGSGPFWFEIERAANNCANNWWINLLYINNYINQEASCMAESWYLACDFQLSILGPFLVLPLIKLSETASLVYLLVINLIAVAIPAGLTYANDWAPIGTLGFSDPSWQLEFYMRTYTRAQPYIFGIFLGYIMFKYPGFFRKQNNGGVEIPKIGIMIGWVVNTCVCLAMIYGPWKLWNLDYTMENNCMLEQCYSTWVSTLYAGLGRLVWSAAVGWIIFTCVTGFAGIINSFLSWSFFAPLSRLGYCAYLIHMHVQFVFQYSQKNVQTFSYLYLVYNYFGHLVITMGLAVVCTLLFESPFIGLEKIIFGSKTSQQKTHVKSDPEASMIQTKEKESAL